MLGDTALKLVHDSRRTAALDLLPAYQEELVRGVCREIRQLDSSINKTQNEPGYDPQDRVAHCNLLVQHLAMRRDKRCLLAYQFTRARRMNEAAWKQTEEPNINGNEQEYMKAYEDLIIDIKGPYTDIDLTGSLEPPNDVFIDVRVLQSVGEVQTEYGVFNLEKDSQFFVRRSDVQTLLLQGYLKEI